jgi:formaldehyde-activating enzyme
VLKVVKKILKSMVGEALVGAGPEIAHVDLVIGPRGGMATIRSFWSHSTNPAPKKTTKK